MGYWYQIIVDRDATEAEAPRVAERMRLWLVERKVIEPTRRREFLGKRIHRPGPAYQSTLDEPNPYTDMVKGLDFLVGRRVFLRLGLSLTCGACKARFEIDGEDALARWHAAVDAWWDGNAAALFTCPQCGVPERLTEWTGDAPWGFGYLGLEFWDWAPLSKQFIREVTEQLGHRTVVVGGKL